MLGKPTALTLEESTDSDLIISWTPPDDGGGAQKITGYDVTVNPGNQTCLMTNTTTLISGITSNTKYVVTVAARNEDNIPGTLSNDLTVITRKYVAICYLT